MLPPARPYKAVRSGMNTKYSSRFETAVGKLENIAHLVKDPTGTVEEDQYHRFANHVAAQLKELPLRSFNFLQSKIKNLITNERLRVMDEESMLSPATSNSNSSEIHDQTPSDVPLSVNTSGLDALQTALLGIGQEHYIM